MLMRNKNMVNVGAFDIIVSSNGNDSTGTGKLDNPYKTIQKGLDTATAGKTVYALPGIYTENISITVSGSPGSQIVLTGARAPNSGEYLSVLNNTTDVSGSWVEDTGVGAGVYKKQLGFEPDVLTIGGKRVPKIHDDHMGVDGVGWDYLAWGAEEQIEVVDGLGYVYFWDGVEVIYAYSGGYTYIRFRNGDNPNNITLRAAGDSSGITINDKSYITINHLEVSDSQWLVWIEGSSVGNIVEDCFLRGGDGRIYIYDGPSYTTIRRNTMTMDYYAGNDYFGAGWSTPYALLLKRWTYDFFKYKVGRGTSRDWGICYINAGDDNSIYDNIVYGGLQGISGYTRGAGRSTYRMKIYNNIVYQMSSIGIACEDSMMDMEIYNNLIYDTNLNIRVHNINASTDYGRRAYIYSNVLWNPSGAGTHLYFHSAATVTPASFPEIWIYNNECIGGSQGTGAKSQIATYGGMPESYIFNNKILGSNNFVTALINIINNEDFALLDYNAWGGTAKPESITGEIFEEHNIFYNKTTYGYCDFTSIDDFLANFDRTDYSITWLSLSTFDPEPPYSAQTWLP